MVERLVRIIILAVRLFHRSQVRAENALFPHHPPASLGIIIIIANVTGQRTRHLVAGTLDPIVGAQMPIRQAC